MIMIVNFQGAKATVRKINFTILLTVFLTITTFIITGCSSLNSGSATTTAGALQISFGSAPPVVVALPEFKLEQPVIMNVVIVRNAVNKIVKLIFRTVALAP